MGEEGPHIGLLEGRLRGLRQASVDSRELECDAVPPAISPVRHDRRTGAGLDRRRQRAPEHGNQRAVGDLEFRRELVIDDDVGLRRRARPDKLPAAEERGFRGEEERRRDTAVGVQLLQGPPVRLRLDRDRWEQAGDARRGEEHVAEELAAAIPIKEGGPLPLCACAQA